MKANWIRVGSVAAGCWLAVAGAARADWPHPPEDIQELVIPVDGRDSGAEVARRDMGNSLGWPTREWARGRWPEREEWATKERGYGVFGNLFGTGGYFALYEPKIADKSGMPTLALAEMGDAEWKLRGLWTIPLDWAPRDERWAGPGQFKKANVPAVPFELRDVIGDEVPEVVVAGEMMKYRQARYVMKYDAKSHGLELLGWSEAEPAKVGNLLRLYTASGNKAVWQEWTFLEWKDGKPVERAAWHSETPYNNVDPFFQSVRTADESGTRSTFRITYGNKIEVTKNGEPFALLTAEWKNEPPPRDFDLLLGAWFFEKLTGLPRRIFPERHGPEQAEKPELGKLEDHAALEMISGSDEAKRRFAENQ